MTFDIHPKINPKLSERLLANLSTAQSELLQASLAGQDVAAQISASKQTAELVLLVAVDSLLQIARSGVRVIMVVPDRKTAQALDKEAGQLTGGKVRCATVVEGVGMASQETALRRGDNLVVATPRRLRDHIQRGSIRLDGLELLIISQADEIVEQELLPDLRFILTTVGNRGRTIFLTGSPGNELASLVEARCPAALRIGNWQASARADSTKPARKSRRTSKTRQKADKPASRASSQQTEGASERTTPTDQTHRIFEVDSHLKASLLAALVKHEELNSMIVFVDNQMQAREVVDRLLDEDIAAQAIYDDSSRKQRANVLEAFNQGDYAVLVVTSRAVRWVKLPSAQNLVNYRFPRRSGDYQRQERRVTANGMVINLVSPEEKGKVAKVVRHLNVSMENETVPGFDYEQPPLEQDDQHSKSNGKPFEWDPEVPRTWGNRATARGNEPEKTLLADYEPPPLPDIWQVAGRYTDVTQKERIPPHKYPLPSAEASQTGRKSKSRRSRRRRRKRSGGSQQRR